MAKDTGGAAYPIAETTRVVSLGENGITARDYFAAAVSPGIWSSMAGDIDNQTCAVAVAQKAYMVADEMLKERAK